jgi:23S rRNA U2552 (ribose-2'-O)-methylase RlmE/FtsJ
MSKIFTQTKHVYVRDLQDTNINLDVLNRIQIAEGNRDQINQLGDGSYANIITSNIIFQLKRVKADLKEKEYDEVRKLTNDFEDIGDSVFMNRAAVKMANMDAVFSLLWSSNIDNLNKESQNNTTNNFVKNDNQITFADLCGGPGGFSEYILWRCPNAKGYGFTLKNTTNDKYSSGVNNDWHLTKFNQYCNVNNFNIEYGDDGTGNILHLNNIEDLSRKVKSGINDQNTGVNVVTADVTRQEIEMYDLLTGQILMALNVLKNGGDFLLKIFNTNTKYTVDLIEIMSYVFENISIFKPVSSRPANAERYLICKKYKYNEKVIELLTDVLTKNNLADIATSNNSNLQAKNNLADIATPNNSNLQAKNNLADIATSTSLKNNKVISILKGTNPNLSLYLRKINEEDHQIQLKYTARSIAVFIASGRINFDFKRTSDNTPIKHTLYREYDLTTFFKIWNIPASKR